MANRTPIELSDGRTRLPIQAQLVEGITLDDAIAADESWRKAMAELLDRAHELGVPPDRHPEHRHWSWEEKRRYAGADREFYGVRYQGEWQALMEVTCGVAAKIGEKPSVSLVYVDYVATAPWNERRFLAAIGEQSMLMGCGMQLMVAALKRSFALRYNGRIGLHSLADAEAFYREKCGMTDLGLDTEYQKLRYFEMTDLQALSFATRYKLWN